jgi:hypothetical protein
METTTVCPASEENGASEKAEIPNIGYTTSCPVVPIRL